MILKSLSKIFAIGQSNTSTLETPLLNLPQRRVDAKSGSEFINDILDLER